jgi:glutaryl-CoA dehydrogenase
MPNDFLNTEMYLTDEARMTRDALREFLAQPRIVELVRECNDKKEPIPVELMRELAQLGIFGVGVEGYTCEKVDAMTYGIIMQEVERCDSALRSFASVQNVLVMYPIWQFGSEEQKQYWLPRLKTLEAVGCFGLTEEHGGSNPAGLRTTARKVGNQYVLNGSKTFITNGSVADIAIVWARVSEGPAGIRGFLVPRGAQGFSTNARKGKWSLAASVTSELFFDNCAIPEENMLPGTEVGLKAALMCLNQARYGIVWGVIGAAEACYETALEYAKTRAPFGTPLASKQLIQQTLVEMALKIGNAKLLAIHLANLKERGELTHVQISAGKLHNVRIACEVASKARNMLGAAGITYEMAVGAHLLNLESVKTYEGTEEVHTLIIGKYLTGFDAF